MPRRTRLVSTLIPPWLTEALLIVALGATVAALGGIGVLPPDVTLPLPSWVTVR